MMSCPETPGPVDPCGAAEIPEHTVILLLEGAQRFLAKAEEAIGNQDALLRDFFLKRVLAILLELSKRVNCAEGGELARNLVKVYDWWGREVLEAGEQDDIDRLKRVSTQMGEIKKSWEQVLFKGQGMSEYPEV